MTKNILIIVLVLLSLKAMAFEEGGHGVGNGGDSSEVRFSSIRQDLHSWITSGGSKYLTLPDGVTLAEYNTKMLSLVGPHMTVVSFTSDVVWVRGVEKTCKNYIAVENKKPNVVCNISRFNSTDEASQYQLVHHEFAGLAGFEKNVGSSSDYAISSQLTGFLSETTVLKLSVKEYSDAPIEIARDQIIKNVAVCAAQCQGESLEHWGHDAAKVGVIYYAPATEDNLSNSALCLTEAKTVTVVSNRMTDYSAKTCMKALTGKYFGKAVNIYTNKAANEADEGTYFAIETVKNKK